MDARGWISVALLASFKRVQALTQSEALVHDVLAFSRVVEVRAGHVRAAAGVWEQYVLPNAPPSAVEGGDDAAAARLGYDDAARLGYDGAPTVEPVRGASVEPDEDEAQDDEEDEVEIVMERP
jgi:la-related protein 1